VAFEYLHLNWELSWPWLTLGNVFANSVSSVQWYEFTGVLGGSFYVLVANLLFFGLAPMPFNVKPAIDLSIIKFLIAFIFWVAAPMVWSKVRYEGYSNRGEPREAVVIQPNIDPYHDKFYGMAESDQIDRMLELSRTHITDSTTFLIWPETAFPMAYWEHELEYLYGTIELRKLIDEYPHIRVITGLSSSRLYTEGEELSSTAKPLGNGPGHYDNYNAAMQIDQSEVIAIHRKSKLVLGVEKVPFLEYLPFMQNLSINLGGTSGGYGYQEHPTVFSENGDAGLAPIICYESIYGEYVNEYVERGAQALAIITNDGWWDDTPGYKQHLAYARLRAIESRKSIARSANTGISAFINQRGDITQHTGWWEPAALRGEVYLNDYPTFYVRFGDYIGRIMAFIAPLLLLLTLVKQLNKTEQRLSFPKP
jgi:apolipoprotein N-acyltransferase